MNIRTRLGILLLAALGVTLPHAAFAAANCSFTTVPSINFGTIDPLALPGTPIQVTATLSVHCTGSLTNLTVSLSSGSAGSFSPRSMNDGSGHTLTYNIYTDNSYSVVFGDGSAGTQTESPTPQNGSATYNFSLFGQLPETGKAIATIDPFKGVYTDTITVTASFF
jgi:spore coat protein U-like protein